MSSFSLVIEYLTGYAVATDPSSRERPEWPPHPARVFMAMTAAHFETNGPGKDKSQQDAEREALEWLAQLDPPDLVIPNHTARVVLPAFVPVNDIELPSVKTINGWNLAKDADKKACRDNMLIPAWRSTNRKERHFPRVHVGSEPVRLIYRVDPDPFQQHLAALEAICRNVTRIGHSSSLVWMRLERGNSNTPTHVTDDSGLGASLRTPFQSILKHLSDLYGADARAKHAEQRAELENLKRQLKSVRGNNARERKAELKKQQEQLETRIKSEPPPPIRPSISNATTYRPNVEQPPLTPHSLFDPNIIVLQEADEATQTFGLESTAQLVAALRGLIQKHSPQPPPPWISGHEPNGDKLVSSPHIALVPLAFVGSPYADGHLMGLAIVFPRTVDHRERARVFAKILFDEAANKHAVLTLQTRQAGEWKVVRATTIPHQQTLKVETYVRPSRVWASVTPVVLDRMPKHDREKDPAAWREECAQIISASCLNIGLPAPIAVRVEKTPFFIGSLRAMPGQGGFPQLRIDKFQVHAKLEFDQPVAGPVIIGAGRYRGYGLCRPLETTK